MKTLRFIWSELISLLVDDGFLAIAALLAIGITWVITREDFVGASNVAGWFLFLLLTASVVVSSRRAVKRHWDSSD